MKRYLYVLVLMFPLSLVAQVEEGPLGFDSAFGEKQSLKDPLEDVETAFYKVIKNFHFVYGMIGKEGGYWDFTFSNKSIFWGDALVKAHTKLLRGKNPKDLSEQVFAYVEGEKEKNSDFQYDFVLWKHPNGYNGYLIEIQDTSRLFGK